VAARSNRAGRKFFRGQKLKKGFTLIELLIVVIIILTLASISAPQYFKLIERFRNSEVLFIMGEIKRAQERFYLKKGVYTNNFSDLDIEIKNEKTQKPCEGNRVCELKYYLIKIKLVDNEKSYFILAKRKEKPPVNKRYTPGYIFFYNHKTGSFGCNDANCVRDFL
jgi:prepilin-type N-terminal cleavage/methylation domain-containing protein